MLDLPSHSKQIENRVKYMKQWSLDIGQQAVQDYDPFKGDN